MRRTPYSHAGMLAAVLIVTAPLAAAAAIPTSEPPRDVASFRTPVEAGAAPQQSVVKNTAVGVTVRTQMTDPDDTDGRLDLRSVGHRLRQVTPDSVRVTYRIETLGRFRDGLLESPDRELVLELHRTRTRGADRNITVSSEDGSLTATVISNATREPIGAAHVTRLGSRTIVVTGSRRLIGARSYFLTSNFHLGGSRECGWRDGWPVTCQDSVPDEGWIRVDRFGWPAIR